MGDPPGEAGELMPAEIVRAGDADAAATDHGRGYGRTSLTPTFREQVSWLSGTQRGIVFVNREDGRVSALDELAADSTLKEMLADTDQQYHDAIGLLVSRGWWNKDESIFIPDRAVAHALGSFGLTGKVWLWARAGRFELWGDRYRLQKSEFQSPLMKRLLASRDKPKA